MSLAEDVAEIETAKAFFRQAEPRMNVGATVHCYACNRDVAPVLEQQDGAPAWRYECPCDRWASIHTAELA